MNVSTTPSTSRLYKLYRLLVAPAILWYLWTARYALTSGEGETIFYAMWGRYTVIFIAIPLCIVLGLTIMRQRPGNIIGPALIVFTCTLTSEATFEQPLPAVQANLNLFVLWIFMWPSNLIIFGYFPSGKIYPRWLGPIVYVAIAACLVTGFSMLFGASTSYGSDYAYSEALANPFQIEGLASVGRVFEDGLQDVVLNSVGLGGIIIMVIRYIVTTKIERKQMRWVIVGFFVAFAAISAQEASTISDDVVFASTVGLIIGSFSLPLSIAMGVLFYRLWDVDVIIRRTFTYAILSALLVGTYLLIVLVFQSLLSGVIASDSSAVIVISTLTVAILFNPLRHRVQRIIDRTFYRKRYDAEATLEAFSEKIRHATEADAIQQYLIESVASTIQPESIGLWLVDSSAKPQL